MLIFLIGFMGSGKSYTARRLSAVLDMPYVDMDDEIAGEQNRSVSEIFEQEGELYFRNAETAWLQKLDPQQNLIISTGGGSPCFNDNMNVMKEKGVTIFLDSARERIIQRLVHGRVKRPLLAGMNELDVGFYYDEKMKERRPFYEQADFHIHHQDTEVIGKLILSLK